MDIRDWFTAVVEDVSDPLQRGRVRIRIFEYHSQSTEDIPTEDLPWSTCLLPVTSASAGGVGQSATGLVVGSWVFGFFRDPADLQDAVVIGSFPGGDIPNVATSFGYGTGTGFNGSSNNFNDFAVGSGSTAYSLDGPGVPIALSGTSAGIIAAGRSQLNVRETSKNQGPGIQKYWGATEYTQGYNDRAPWCAAFVCWCVQQAGIFTEADRPKTASAFGFETWAKSKRSVVQIQSNPRAVQAGDLIVFSFSHIGIATKNSSGNTFSTIDGNTSNGVFEKPRNLSSVRSAIRIMGPQSNGAASLG
jgi:hypothetical protein